MEQDSSTPPRPHPPCESRWLGRMVFDEALVLQDSLVEQRRNGEIPDTVLFLEHEPVYTIGRTRDRSSLRDGGESLPHPVVEINRGGQATYHGPGQLVGYLILDLHTFGLDLHTYLRALEQGLIDFLEDCGVAANRRDGLTGAWVEDRKIASIGVGARRWITMHGFALNVSRDLSGFEAIVPCGIRDVTMTSLERETARDWEIGAVAEQIQPHLERALAELAK